MNIATPVIDSAGYDARCGGLIFFEPLKIQRDWRSKILENASQDNMLTGMSAPQPETAGIMGLTMSNVFAR